MDDGSSRRTARRAREESTDVYVLARSNAAIAAEGGTPGRLVHELRLADERLVPGDRAHLILRVALDPVATRR